MYTREEAEGRRLKNPFDTITEGIGINRLTENFKLAKLDGAFRGTDMEAVEMSRFVQAIQLATQSSNFSCKDVNMQINVFGKCYILLFNLSDI